MFLRKDQPGSAPGHTWDHPGQVIEVDDALGEQLLAITHAGFSEVAPPAPEPEPEPEDDADAPDDAPEEDASEDKPKRRGGRPRLPRDAEGNIIRTEISE